MLVLYNWRFKMAYCKNCGNQIDDNAVVCPFCGAQQQAVINPAADTGSFGWSVLGFCIPLVGLILYLVWKDTKPVSSKQAGIGALVGFVLGILFYVIGIAAGAAAGGLY